MIGERKVRVNAGIGTGDGSGVGRDVSHGDGAIGARVGDGSWVGVAPGVESTAALAGAVDVAPPGGPLAQPATATASTKTVTLRVQMLRLT
jgi:hypothetical protein